MAVDEEPWTIDEMRQFNDDRSEWTNENADHRQIITQLLAMYDARHKALGELLDWISTTAMEHSFKYHIAADHETVPAVEIIDKMLDLGLLDDSDLDASTERIRARYAPAPGPSAEELAAFRADGIAKVEAIVKATGGKPDPEGQ